MKQRLKPYFETSVVTIIYLAISYYFSPSDPLLLNGKIPFLVILFTIITLLNGVKNGLFSLFLVSIVLVKYYHSNYLEYILFYLILVLILGQFYHNWFDKTTRLENTSSYAYNRLNEINSAFYALKISHDSLEKSYALKPKSIRSSFKELEQLYFKDGSHFENFIHFITKTYNIESAVIAVKEENNFQTVASYKAKHTLMMDDPLVKDALRLEKTSYISQEENSNSNYLVVIPTKKENEDVTSILAIEKMPFLEFHKNNIVSITILFSYFMDQLKLWQHIKERGGEEINLNQMFNYHRDNLLSLKSNHDIDSSMIIIKPNNELSQKKIENVLKTSLRTLDKYKVENKIAHILLPLTNTHIADVIIRKIQDKVENQKLEYLVFGINQEKLISQYTKE
jgi:hypothetical protein